MHTDTHTFGKKISDPKICIYSFSAVFVGNSVTPISTPANNKQSCSKNWKLSGQNCVFPPAFFRRNIWHDFVTPFSTLANIRAPSRLSRPRPIDCDAGLKQTVKIFPFFLFQHRKQFFFVFSQGRI